MTSVETKNVKEEAPPGLELRSMSSFSSTDSPLATVRAAEMKKALSMPDAPGLSRQLTMGGMEELEKDEDDGRMLLHRQDTLGDVDLEEQLDQFAAAQQSSSSQGKQTSAQQSSSSQGKQTSPNKKRVIDDLQPEPLLKRQETIEEADQKMKRGDSPVIVPLYRSHSLLDQSESDANPLNIRNPFDGRGVVRDSPTLFSTQSRVENTDTLFVNVPEDRPQGRNTSPLSPGPMSPSTDQAEERDGTRGPLRITRQESWKEDVSDAGWRAW